MNHEARKGSTLIILLGVLVVAVIAAAAVWYFMQNHSSSAGTCCDIPAPYATSSVQAVSVTSSSTTSSTAGMAAWKTYTNSADGFSFQYPSNLFINGDSGSSSVILSSNATSALASEYDLAVSMDTNPSNLSMQKYFSDDTNDNGANLYTRATISTTTVDSLPATVFNGSTLYNMTSNEVVVVPYQGGFLEIVNNNLDGDTFDAVLKSFKLATNTSLSGWQTYINQQYGFSMQYPSSWSVDGNANNTGGGVIFNSSSTANSIYISVDLNPKNLSMQNYYNNKSNVEDIFDPNYPPYGGASTTINGMTAYDYQPGIGETPGDDILIPRKGFFVRIETMSEDDPTTQKIISTFQLTKSQ